MPNPVFQGTTSTVKPSFRVTPLKISRIQHSLKMRY
jgi:hypothetical protein